MKMGNAIERESRQMMQEIRDNPDERA